MTNNLGVLDALTLLAQRGASGELICTSADREAHVFLLRGRVAWAFETNVRSVFWSTLAESCGLDEDGRRAVVEEGKRTRRSVGDIMVEWSLATPSQVFEAANAQVRTTLERLLGSTLSRHIFLERESFAEQEVAWTFDLLSFDLGRASRGGRRALRSSLPPPAEHRRASAARSGLCSVDAVIDADELGDDPRFPAVTRADALLDSSTDLVVAKTPERWIVGFANEHARRWAALHPSANLGAVFSQLVEKESVARTGAPSKRSAATVAGSERASSSPDPRWRGVLDVVSHYAEVLAVFVMGPDGSVLDWLAPSGVDWSPDAARAARVHPLLDDPESPSTAGGVNAVAVRSDSLLLGARVGDASVWCAVRPETPLGIAWILLGMLLRKTREIRA